MAREKESFVSIRKMKLKEKRISYLRVMDINIDLRHLIFYTEIFLRTQRSRELTGIRKRKEEVEKFSTPHPPRENDPQ